MTTISYGEMELRLAHARKQGAADGFQQGWHAALQRMREGDKIHDLAELVPKCDEPAKPEAGPMQDTESLSGVQALGSSGLAQSEGECHSSDAAGVVDCDGNVSRAARSVSNAEAIARAWLDRQIVRDGREPLLDEGDCRLCGSPAGEGHEPTDPCGVVSELLRELERVSKP